MMFQLTGTARSTSVPVNSEFLKSLCTLTRYLCPTCRHFKFDTNIRVITRNPDADTTSRANPSSNKWINNNRHTNVLRWARGKKMGIQLNDQTTKQRGNATLIDRIQKNQGTFWNYWGAGRNWGSQRTYATNWQRQKETYVTHEERHSLETQIPNARSNKQEGITLRAQTIIREIAKLSWSSDN